MYSSTPYEKLCGTLCTVYVKDMFQNAGFGERMFCMRMCMGVSDHVFTVLY